MAQFRVASYGVGGTFHLEVDGVNVTGAVAVPDTGWWQTWQTISRQVALPAGRKLARLVMDTPGANAVGNFDWFAIAALAQGGRLPGRLVAADFDSGAEGVAYHDESAGNSGGAYRSTGVDIEACAEGGYNVGWIGGRRMAAIHGECCGVRLVCRPPESCLAGRRRHAACERRHEQCHRTGHCSAHRRLAGVDHHCVPIALAAGQQTLGVVFDSPGFNLQYLDVATQ